VKALLRLFVRAFRGDALLEDSQATLDHVPVRRARKKRDWRDRALKDAAAKYGRAFKCAGKGIAHEVIGREPTPANVTAIRKVAR
jgi:hypothetical protein